MAPKAEQCWVAILVSQHAGNAIAAVQQDIYGAMSTIVAVSNVYSTYQATLSPPVGSVIVFILSLILKAVVMYIPVPPMAKMCDAIQITRTSTLATSLLMDGAWFITRGQSFIFLILSRNRCVILTLNSPACARSAIANSSQLRAICTRMRFIHRAMLWHSPHAAKHFR